MQTTPEQYLSIGEASEYLGVSIDTLRRWTKKGKVLSYRSPGRHRYFKKADLDQVFGTRYEREEKEDQPLAVSPQPFHEPKIQNQQPMANVEEPIVDSEPSLHNTENMDYVQAPSMDVTEEAKEPSVQPALEEKKPLNVPRYIKHQNISKYDLLLAPNLAGEIEEKIAEETKPISIDNLDFHPILIPSTHRPPTPKETEKTLIVEEKPEVRSAIQEALQKEEPKDHGKFEKILKRSFFVFLALDAILFFFWFLNYRVSSPLP